MREGRPFRLRPARLERGLEEQLAESARLPAEIRETLTRAI